MTAFGFPLHDTRDDIVEATSLLGHPLVRPSLDAETRARLSANLDAAWRAWVDESGEDNDDGAASEMAFIWLGRRLAYLGRYKDAITVYTAGLEAHPDSYKLRRHRGHRFITTRRFDDALGDLAEAWRIVTEGEVPDAVEPDGAPNDRNMPRTTTQSNIVYHLALAHYLRGEYAEALAVHHAGEAVSGGNDDQRVSSGNWVYRTLRKLGRNEEAATHLSSVLRPGMEIIENDSYHRLLLAYRAGVTPESVGEIDEDPVYRGTVAYGLAAELEANGYANEARAMFDAIITGDASWASFGFIAAEAEAGSP